MAKTAYKVKKALDVRDNLIMLGPEAYALRLILECKLDERRCSQAFDVLRFGFAMIGEQGSLPDQFACHAGQLSMLSYFSGVEAEIGMKIVNDLPPEDERKRLEKQKDSIHAMMQTAFEKCGSKG